MKQFSQFPCCNSLPSTKERICLPAAANRSSVFRVFADGTLLVSEKGRHLRCSGALPRKNPGCWIFAIGPRTDPVSNTPTKTNLPTFAPDPRQGRCSAGHPPSRASIVGHHLCLRSRRRRAPDNSGKVQEVPAGSHTGIKVLRKRRTRTASESGLHGDPRIGKLQAIRYDVSSSRRTISAAPAPPIEAPPQARFLQTATLGWIGTWWAHWVDAIDSRPSVLAGVDQRCVLSARLSPSCSLALSLLFATMAEKGYPGLFERRAV